MSKEIEFAAGVTMDASGLFDWINRATPYLKSELWRVSDCLAMCSDCLAMCVESGLGADFDKEIDEKLEQDHKELTELLTQVGALEK